MSVIRFPTKARWDHDAKSEINWMRRLWWKLIGHRRRANVAKLRIDRARYGR